MTETLSYSEKSKGWTSFHSFVPDWMARLNNRFFSIKDGQLYLHNDADNPIRNNFYGVQYSSKMVTEFNDAPGDDKIFKTLILQGDRPWDALIETNLSNCHITLEEFNKRESRWFAHTRKNEDVNDYHGHTAQGIGNIVSFVGENIRFNSITDMISVGDQLIQLNGSSEEIIGDITFINRTTNVITIGAPLTTPPVPGYYAFVKKNARVEGAEIRGYHMKVTLENNENGDAELFAITTNAVKSYV